LRCTWTVGRNACHSHSVAFPFQHGTWYPPQGGAESARVWHGCSFPPTAPTSHSMHANPSAHACERTRMRVPSCWCVCRVLWCGKAKAARLPSCTWGETSLFQCGHITNTPHAPSAWVSPRALPFLNQSPRRERGCPTAYHVAIILPWPSTLLSTRVWCRACVFELRHVEIDLLTPCWQLCTRSPVGWWDDGCREHTDHHSSLLIHQVLLEPGLLVACPFHLLNLSET